MDKWTDGPIESTQNRDKGAESLQEVDLIQVGPVLRQG